MAEEIRAGIEEVEDFLMDNIIELKNITKSFPGVVALSDVSLEIKRGEIHSLCGENGAGKSTLINLLSGVHQPTEGELFIRGNKEVIETPLKAEHLKIATSHQEVPLCQNISIAENIFLSANPKTKFIFMDRAYMREETNKVLALFDYKLDPDELMGNLTVAEQTIVQISKAIRTEPDVLILDEPTAALTTAEKDKLFSVLRDIRSKRDLTIVYISHKLEEVFELTDRITVLRDGKLIGTLDAGNTEINEIISMMVGRDIQRHIYSKNRTIGDEVLKVDKLCRQGVLSDISFSLKRGEILGVAGLQGAGRTEILRAIFGLDRIDSGEIKLNGQSIQIKSPEYAIRAGIAMISENRRDEGIVPIMSTESNLIMVIFKRLAQLGLLRRKSIDAVTEEYVNKLRIKISSAEQLIANLSGGNQQKVIIARWLAGNPQVLMCDEPTKGIDVGAKSEIHDLLGSLAEEGMSVIIVSSELPELLSICDRVLVVHSGSIAGEVAHKDLTEEKVMLYATGLAQSKVS